MNARSAQEPTRLRVVGRTEWEDLCSGFADYSYRQSWAYAHRQAIESRAAVECVAVESGDGVVGLASVRIKRMPILGGGIAYVGGGPLVRRWGQGAPAETALRHAIGALASEYEGARSLTLRVVLPILSGDRAAVDGAVLASGLTMTAGNGAYHTLLVDVTPPLEAIRAKLAQKWRNQLNAAERKGLGVEAGEGGALLERFGSLFHELLDRKKFHVRIRPEMFGEIQADSSPNDRVTVLLATEGGRDVAGIVVSFLGDTPVYLLGATSAAGMQCKAAYLLQWEAIRRACERGCRWYDLGGIDPHSNPGVYHFKSGMGGLEASAAGPAELCPRGWRSTLVALGEGTYRRLRAMKQPSPG